jgi:hypothetical protein
MFSFSLLLRMAFDLDEYGPPHREQRPYMNVFTTDDEIIM